MCDELVRREANLEFVDSPIQIALKLGINKYSKIWENNHTSVLRNGRTKSTIPIQTKLAITLANGHLPLFMN